MATSAVIPLPFERLHNRGAGAHSGGWDSDSVAIEPLSTSTEGSGGFSTVSVRELLLGRGRIFLSFSTNIVGLSQGRHDGFGEHPIQYCICKPRYGAQVCFSTVLPLIWVRYYY